MLSQSVLKCRYFSINRYLNRPLSSSSRPVAEFDQCIDDYSNIETSETRRKHPGAFDRRIVQLPERLKNAAEKIIQNTSADGNLSQLAKNLENHLVFKKAPLSESCFNGIKAKCTEKVLASYPIIGNSIWFM